MRRLTLLAALLLTATACDIDWYSSDGWGWEDDMQWFDEGNYDRYLRGEPDGFRQQSSIWVPADGVAFDEQGAIGVAGMSAMTCRFDATNGAIDLDVDPSSGVEVVHDARFDDGFVVVTTSDEGVQTTDFSGSSGSTLEAHALPGAIGAWFTDRGIVALQDDAGCHVAHLATGDSTYLGATCAGASAATDGRVFAVADGSVVVVRPNGTVTDTGVTANLVAYDPVHDHLYVALRGADSVSAITAAGTQVWTTQVGGRIVTLDTLGDSGDLLVGVSAGSDGLLLRLDGATGETVAQADTFQAPEAVWSSPRGDVIAVRAAWNSHVLRLE